MSRQTWARVSGRGAAPKNPGAPGASAKKFEGGAGTEEISFKAGLCRKQEIFAFLRRISLPFLRCGRRRGRGGTAEKANFASNFPGFVAQ